MATINTTVVSGRLTDAPELRYTPNGVAVAHGSIAVTDGYGDNEKTFFFNYEAWKHTAEYMGNYAKKGMPVTLAGKLTQQTWQATDGTNRSKVVLRVSEAILPPKGASNGNDNANGGAGYGNAGSGSTHSDPQLGYGEEVVFDDSDLPF